MDSDDTEYFTLEDLTQLRHALSTFINPSTEITEAINKLDKHIAKTINNITQET